MNNLKNIILKPNKSILLPRTYYKNKNVLVSGGGTGLGKNIAYTYSQLGANVTILGRRENKLQESKESIESKTGNTVNYYSLDVRDYESVRDISNKMEVQDIVINNAAGNILGPIKNLSNNAINSVIDIVLKGTINITLEFGKKMIENNSSGTILNISTTYAKTGSSFVIPSAVAKAGCDNLTKSLGSEWGKYGIRTLSVAPGPIYTEGAFSRLDPNNTFSNKAKEKMPLKRLGEKEELSNLISFLTSDYNNWMTGQIINLDGGEVIGNSGEFNSLHFLTEEDWKSLH